MKNSVQTLSEGRTRQGRKPDTAGRKAARRQARHKRRWNRLRKALVRSLAGIALVVGAMYAVGFLTPWGNKLRIILAETIVSTRHAYLAKAITTPSEYHSLLKQLYKPVENTSVSTLASATGQQGGGQGAGSSTPDRLSGKTNPALSTPNIQVNAIAGPGYNGYVMLVHNPQTIRLVHAKIENGKGEYITHMIPRVGAVAGTNASGFIDPKGAGWGAKAYGLELVGGQVLAPAGTRYGMVSVGFTKAGRMVMGDYTPTHLLQLGVQDAVQFYPELVVNGKPMITQGDGGWGYGPRTAIGQRKDGTVIFVVTNGRFHGGGGMGASQRQVMNVMLKYGAVNACAMDGGSSSVIYNKGKILNSPSTIDPNGERHLPDAWLVFPSVNAAQSYQVGQTG